MRNLQENFFLSGSGPGCAPDVGFTAAAVQAARNVSRRWRGTPLSHPSGPPWFSLR